MGSKKKKLSRKELEARDVGGPFTNLTYDDEEREAEVERLRAWLHEVRRLTSDEAIRINTGGGNGIGPSGLLGAIAENVEQALAGEPKEDADAK